MDGTTLQQIRDVLLSRRRSIHKALERTGTHQEDGMGGSAEIIDIAQSIEQIDRDKSLAEQERRDLYAIERALTKMATVAFGVCEDPCQAAHGAARGEALRALPGVRRTPARPRTRHSDRSRGLTGSVSEPTHPDAAGRRCWFHQRRRGPR